MRQYSNTYIFLFAAAVCLACSSVISVAAVSLRERQMENALLDRQQSVLRTAQLVSPTERLAPEEIRERFAAIESHVVDLATGDYAEGVDPATFDPDTADRMAAPSNPNQIREIPVHAQVFHVREDGKLKMLVLPVYGQGLWGTMYGYIAVDPETAAVRGITFYDHIETPGLGGEIDNARWKGLWPGRKVYDEDGDVALQVIRGAAGPVSEDPHRVDGLSGATITGRGVTNLLRFWFGEHGFGPYLEKLREREFGSA